MLKLHSDLGDSEAVIHQNALSSGMAVVWLSVVTRTDVHVCGFLRLHRESNCWCIDLSKGMTSKRSYGLNRDAIDDDLESISNYMITNMYTYAKGGILGYLTEVNKKIQAKYMTATIELVSVAGD